MGVKKNRKDSLVYLMPEKQIPPTHRCQRRERTQGSLIGTAHGRTLSFLLPYISQPYTSEVPTPISGPLVLPLGIYRSLG